MQKGLKQVHNYSITANLHWVFSCTKVAINLLTAVFINCCQIYFLVNLAAIWGIAFVEKFSQLKLILRWFAWEVHVHCYFCLCNTDTTKLVSHYYGNKFKLMGWPLLWLHDAGILIYLPMYYGTSLFPIL